MPKLCFLIHFVLIGFFVSGQQGVEFKHIPLGNPNAPVFSIAKDNKGFIWFGNEDGIVKYDGYQSKTYIPKEFNNLDFAYVWRIMADDNFIWVGTSRGVFRFDPEKEDFARIILDTNNLNANKAWIVGFYKDSKGHLWVAAYNQGLYRYDTKTGNISCYSQNNRLTSDKIWTIYGETNNNEEILWVGSDAGLDKIVLAANNMTKKKQEHYQFGTIKTIFRDRSNTVWIGCPEKGIYQVNETTGQFISFNAIFNIENDASDKYVGDIVEDPNGIIWVKEFNEGLYSYNKKNKKSRHYVHNYHNYKSISSNYGTGLYVDKQGIIWVAAKGVDKIDSYNKKFRRYVHEPGNENSLSSNYVSTVLKDAQGSEEYLWIGTLGGGLNKLNLGSQQFTHFKVQKSKANGLPSDTISCLLKTSSGQLWAGTWGKGIAVLLDENSKQFKTLQVGSNIIKGLFEDSQHTIWVATSNSLCKYHPLKEMFTCFPIKSIDFSSELLTTARFYEDSNKRLWLSRFNGLVKYDLETQQIEHYNPENRDKRKIQNYTFFGYEDLKKTMWFANSCGLSKYIPASNDFVSYFQDTTIWTIYEDSKGRFWVGTDNLGLYEFDRETGQKQLSELDKKLLANAYLIFGEDKHGNLWINNGVGNLVRFNPENNETKVYDASDGLPEEYFTVPYEVLYQQNKEEFYTIGLGGFSQININQVKENKSLSDVYITGMFLNNKEVLPGTNSLLEKHISYTDEITLGHDQNYFSFEFSALDYINPQKIRYCYQLEGFDEEWIYTDASSRKASYTNINPGAYIFKVKATNSDGFWNEKPRKLKITIRPPFWATWWAYVLYALLLLFAAYRYRLLVIRREAEKSDMRVKQLEIEKMKELDDYKSRFFANISHEFRTPLSLIMGSIEQLHLDGKVYGTQKKEIGRVQENSERLFRLVNQLLELSKLDEGKMKLRLAHGNLSEAVRYILAAYESVAERKQIKFELIGSKEDVFGYWDQDKLEIILHNLLSNAFKHTGEQGEIKFTHRVLAAKELPDGRKALGTAYQGSYLYFCVADSGKGIPKEKLESIFQRFEKAGDKSYSEGMGIGLALTRELVDFQKGSLFLESEAGKGAKFHVYLPIEKDAFGDDVLLEVVDNEDFNNYVQGFDQNLTLFSGSSVEDEVNTVTSNERGEGAETILVVEDNKDMQLFIKKNLEKDYKIALAGDGHEGINKAIDQVPDLVITDLMMPKKDGLELCQSLKNDERTSHIPIIILTAKAAVENRVKGLQSGADEYLEKPFKLIELRAMVANLIKQRKLLKKKYAGFLHDNQALYDVENLDGQFLRKAYALAEENMSNTSWGVDEFSSLMNLSRSQLFRKIKALTDMTVSEFILSVKLKKASMLLENNAGTITDIAFQSGFNDSSYFAKCFKKKYGVSPRSYALKHKNPPDAT